MEDRKKTPELRFAGFTIEWNEEFAEHLCSISTGNSNTQDNVQDGLYPFYVRSATVERSDKYLFDEEAVLTVGDGVGTGKVYHYVNGKYDLHQRVYRMYNFREITGKFFYYIFSRNFQQRVFAMTAKTSVDSVRLEMISKMKISFPIEIEEQKKIEVLLSFMDELIIKHQQKHNRLVTLKKSMLEKMFPKEGKAVPEIRFTGFEGDWIFMSIDQIADRYDNLRVPIKAELRVSGSTPYYGANGIQGYVKGFTHKGEYILVAEDGANDIKNYPIQYVNGEVWVNNHAHVLQAKKSIAENLFLKYALTRVNIEPFLTGGGRAKLNAEVMMNIEVSIPRDLNEQKKLGGYFQNIETLIDKHDKQLKKLTYFKQSLIEKMFV